MGNPTGPAGAAVPVETKASMFQGYVAALRRVGLLDDVRARVSERTRALIDRPPLVTTWISHEPTDDLLVAVHALRGTPMVRRISRDAALNGIAPAVRSIIEKTLRLVGASPASLLSRLQTLTSSAARGSQWAWEPKSPTSGMMTVRFPARSGIPDCVFEGIGGSLEAVFDLAGVEGKVSTPEALPGRDGARFFVKWSSGD